MAEMDVLARISHLSYAYPGATTWALADVSIELGNGLTVVAGSSGGGKSTLLRLLNGLVPHAHGGSIRGSALVGGDDVLTTPTRRLARRVGFVFQDPEMQFVASTVEREVAFGLENVGVDRAEMRRRVAEALESVGAGNLRGRTVATLSGGERQRVSLAAAIALRPPLVALDEPLSQLDPDGAATVVEACARLLAAGTAIVVSEHRLERLLPIADQLIVVDGGQVAGPAEPRLLVDRLPSPPQVVELALALGWLPVPLDVAAIRPWRPRLLGEAGARRPRPIEGAWSIEGVTAGPGRSDVLDRVSLEGRRGEVVVLMGPNGGGKTTLLRVLAGLLRPRSGTCERLPGRLAYLPQDPAALLHRTSVRAEVEATLGWAGSAEPADRILEALDLLAVAERYPGDLSSGQRQRAAIACVLAGEPAIALLDEPTRGMDRAARARLVTLLGRLRDLGSSVVVATHDADLAAELGDRIVRVAGGRAEEIGPPEVALSGDTPWSTEIGRLFPGGPVTVAGLLARLAPLATAGGRRGRAVPAAAGGVR